MEWKDIKDYEGLYQISNSGKVKSIKTNTILKPSVTMGYEKVYLYKNGKRKYVRVHRLVAEAFVYKNEGCSEVNHIDENRANNNANNLEWVTPKQNSNHGKRNSKIKNSLVNNNKISKEIMSINIQNGSICIYPSFNEAERCGYNESSIRRAMFNGKNYRGYKWRYI